MRPTRIVLSLACLLALGGGAAWADADDLVINEVFYLGGADEDWVEILNTGSDPTPVDISGFWICSRRQYCLIGGMTILDGDLSLSPGEIVRIGTNASCSPLVRDLDAVSAEVGLYRNAAFGSSASMIDFVQYGADRIVNSGGVERNRSSVASTKAIWTQTQAPPTALYDFVPTAGPGQSLTFCGTESGGGSLTLSSDFLNTDPTPGAANPDCPFFADGFESGNTDAWSSLTP